jgi:hypothetical protein
MAHIHSMARLGRTDEVAACLANGADKNALSPRGGTPLTLAASAGHLDVIKMLLRSGANPNLADRRGKTPLMHAVGHDWLDTVEMLLSAGADVNLGNTTWGPPIAYAALRNNRAMFDLLLAAGGDPSAPGHEGKTATEWLEIGGIAGQMERLCPTARGERDEQGRFIATDRDHAHVRMMMGEGLSPDEYMAKHGRTILVWSAARSVYSDPDLQSWVTKAADVLFDSEKLAQAEEQYLIGADLESARRHRARLSRSQDRYKRRHRPRSGTDGL